MSFVAAFNFIFRPLSDFHSHITAPIKYARGICTAEASHSANPTEDHLSGSEESTSGSDSDSDIEDKDLGICWQTRHKHLPRSLAISPPRATTESADRGGLAEDLEPTDLTFTTNLHTKPAPGFFGFPPKKTSFAIPFVSGLQSKLFTVTGISAFSGPGGDNTAEGQLLGESFRSSAKNTASPKVTGSSVLPSPFKPSHNSHSASAAVSASPRSRLASTFCQFCRSQPSSVPRTHSSGHPPTVIGTAPTKGPFDNFVNLPPPLPSDQLYTTLPRSVPHHQSTLRAACTPALDIEMADPTVTSSPKPTAATPKNIPWNRVYEIHTSQLHGHLRFLKLLAANKGHSQPLTQCISRAETLLKDATAAAAASGISTAGPVPAKPEKRRRSVRFEDEVTKQAKPEKKTKTAHKPIRRPKMRHAKPSEARIAALFSTLGKRARDESSDSDNSSVGDAAEGERVIRKKIRKEYYTPGMVLEFESSDDEDDEEFVPSSEAEEEELGGADGDSDKDGDADGGEQDPSPSPEVDRRRAMDGGAGGKRPVDKDVNKKRVAREDVEHDAAAAKDVPETNKKRKIVVVSSPKRAVPSTQEGEEAGRGKKVRPS
ncbi:unnamed protein product [Tuber aestivum]|uniref:Uncharacterized protein n=1 Tax=Tuber aestivum TaxID=59557 RepID=A0A292Q8X2_9PEZI|nr:unnamed protein product [Tuber aestivum]